MIITQQMQTDQAAQMIARVEASAIDLLTAKVGKLLERIAQLETEKNDLGAMLDKALNRIDELEARNG